MRELKDFYSRLTKPIEKQPRRIQQFAIRMERVKDKHIPPPPPSPKKSKKRSPSRK